MTIETCKIRLSLATTDEEKQFWTERIARKMKKKGMVVEEIKEKKNVKKPKR